MIAQVRCSTPDLYQPFAFVGASRRLSIGLRSVKYTATICTAAPLRRPWTRLARVLLGQPQGVLDHEDGQG